METYAFKQTEFIVISRALCVNYCHQPNILMSSEGIISSEEMLIRMIKISIHT